MQDGRIELLRSLIDQVPSFEERALRLQDATEPPDFPVLLTALEEDYNRWYAASLSSLPENLMRRFEKEHEGRLIQPKIKSFLEDPRRPNVLLATGNVRQTTLLKRWQYPFETSFRAPIRSQRQLLLNTLTALTAGSPGITPAEPPANRPASSRNDIDTVFDLLGSLSRRLPEALSVLARPVRGRPGILVNDEYDLQRIIHAILCLHFSDVREEEYGASTAGAHPRFDFLIRDVSVVVETKMTRESLTAKRLGDELASDILRYQQRGIAGVFALVYDPQRRVRNPTGFMNDMHAHGTFMRVSIVH